MKVKNSDRINFFKFRIAAHPFQEALAILEELEKGHEEDKLIKHPFWTAFVVSYTRPFKQRKKLRISEDMVPDEHRSEHQALMVFRDKLLVHMDLNGPRDDKGDSLYGLFL